MAQNLNRPARLLGLEDSDSDSQGDRDTGAGGVGAAGRQSPQSPPDDVPAADPAPAAPAPPVHINTHRYTHNTYRFIQIHTGTYIYDFIESPLFPVIRVDILFWSTHITYHSFYYRGDRLVHRLKMENMDEISIKCNSVLFWAALALEHA